MTARTPAERRQQASALPPVPDTDAADIAAFLDAIWAESGLARPTLDSYRRDLEGFARWRDGRGGGLAATDRAGLFDYLAWRTRQGYSPRSNARLLSALRAFFAHRLRQGLRRDDPTALLDPPRLPRSLPKALAESEIDALLAAPDTATPLGLRDRAMLELMYAAGLRVSELVHLPATAVNLRQGVLRVTGKGSKDRLVPLGEESQHWLETYLAQARPALAGKRSVPSLFLGTGGRTADPTAVLDLGEALCGGGRHRPCPHQPARTAAQLRHPPAQPRRRPARPATAAGTQLAVDHADLHAGGARTPQAAARPPSPARMNPVTLAAG